MNRIRNKIFEKIHMGNLVYNTCWEDPRCDRELLSFDSRSSVVMITSAGCNALDYLLDNPAEIHCVDMNARQNALLQLKMAAIRAGDSEALFSLFGKGRMKHASAYYRDALQANLPEFASRYWDRRIRLFQGKGLRRSFYYRGTSGAFAWLLMNLLRTRPGLRQLIRELIESPTLDIQRQRYAVVEKKLFGALLRWVMNRHITLSMLGVPDGQQRLIRERGQDGMIRYLRETLEHVFTQVPLQDNYFWRVYVMGAYSEACCPNYLRPEHQATLRSSVNRISTTTSTLSAYLRQKPGPYSHFILLDHQDWMSRHQPAELEEEWRLILQNSRAGTRILMRSAAEKIDFIPEFVKNRVSFGQQEVQKQARLDRVGTYKGIEMGIVQ